MSEKDLLAEIDRIEIDYVDGGEECRGQDTRLGDLMDEVRAAVRKFASPPAPPVGSVNATNAPPPPAMGSVAGMPCEIVASEATGANPPAPPDGVRGAAAVLVDAIREFDRCFPGEFRTARGVTLLGAADALLASLASPHLAAGSKWTKERPTIDKPYWYQEFCGARQIWTPPHVVYPPRQPEHLGGLDRRWSGPIPEPEGK